MASGQVGPLFIGVMPGGQFQYREEEASVLRWIGMLFGAWGSCILFIRHGARGRLGLVWMVWSIDREHMLCSLVTLLQQLPLGVL